MQHAAQQNMIKWIAQCISSLVSYIEGCNSASATEQPGELLADVTDAEGAS